MPAEIGASPRGFLTAFGTLTSTDTDSVSSGSHHITSSTVVPAACAAESADGAGFG
jgi:hypothetical protein